MREPTEREKRSLHAATQIRRWAHAIENERVRASAFGRVVAMRPRIETDVVNPPAVEFREHRPEPIWVFVINGDRLTVGAAQGMVLVVASTLSGFESHKQRRASRRKP